MLGISRVAAHLAASEEGLSYLKGLHPVANIELPDCNIHIYICIHIVLKKVQTSKSKS
jgi:hypothetical protein